MSWSHLKLYSQWISGVQYEIHSYFVPHVLDKRIKFLKKYFRVIDRTSIPHVHKRRKSPVEFAETAVMILARLNAMCKMDIPIVVGSAYLDKMPWAIFGNAPGFGARHLFHDFDGIADHYRKLLVKGCSSAEHLHFRVVPTLSWQLADEYNISPSFVVSLSICLLHDIILNCGPDCEELYDLFSNDLRVQSVSLHEWQDLRCKILGRHGKINDQPHDYAVGQIYEPRFPLISSTRIVEISEDDDLAGGEKVHFMRCPVVDDYAKRAEKYSYLGLSIDRWQEDQYGIPIDNV